MFKAKRNNDNELSRIFEKEEDLDEATEMFITKLNEHIKKCFTKIRITDKPNKEIEHLFRERKKLRNKTDKLSLEKLIVEEKLAEKCSQANYIKIS